MAVPCLIRKRLGLRSFAFFSNCSSVSTCSSSCTQQSTGHTETHCCSSKNPTHSVQRSGSISKMSSPMEIALFGHSGSQAMQLVHSSVIFKAIFFLLFFRVVLDHF